MSKTIHILGENGAPFKLTGPAITQFIEDRLLKGYLTRVNADGTPYKGADPDRPKTTDSKAAWVGYAVYISKSTDSPITPDDAEALTKQDLIEMYGVNVPKK